jgi:Flp pilus assembly protein TadD
MKAGVLLAGMLLQGALTLQAGDLLPADEDPLAISEEMKQFLAERVPASLGPYERLELLVHLIFRDPALRFTYVPKTYSAARTFRERSGNCLSYTNMLVAMARELGLKVQFREVEVPPTWTMHGRIVVMSSHVNVLALIGGRAYVVDLFPELNRVTLGGRVISDARARAHFYSNLGAEELANGNGLLAVDYYRRALAEDDTVEFVWVNLGVALTTIGRFEEAERAYKRALQLTPDDPLAMSNLARLYERLGDSRKAAWYEERALKFRLKNPYYHFRLGEEALRLGQAEAAVAHFRRALDRKFEEHHFHFALAKAYDVLGQTDKVIRELELARRFAPDPSGQERYSRKLDLLLARN